MAVVRTLSILGVAIMAVAIVLGLLAGGFSDEGSEILALTWGKVTLVDLYVGFVFFGLWVWARERKLTTALPWWVALVFLGNFAAALYLARASFASSTINELLTGEPRNPATTTSHHVDG
jgi:hypothetical protein